METQSRLGNGTGVRAVARKVGRLIASASFEVLLLVLLLLTIAAVKWQDSILLQTTRLTPQIAATHARIGHTDDKNGGRSTAREQAPFRWSCELRTGFDYPYCGYELFFGSDAKPEGLDLSNFRSLAVTLIYRGEGKSFRLHLKNYDPRYSKAVTDDSSKFNRVEYPTTPGRVQTVVFDQGDFGVADWWIQLHDIPPKFSHPQFDNITSVDIQTGTEIVLGHHEFDVREIVLKRSLLSDAQWYLSLLGFWVVLIGAYLAFRIRNLKGELDRRRAMQAAAMRQAEEAAEAARNDHLTKVFNRRGLAERYAMLSEYEVEPMPVAIVLIDIDRFKALNDCFGHAYGDEVLSAVASLIKRNVRVGDTVGRWGGEEFVVICPGLDAEQAMAVAEKLRRRIEHFHFGDCEHITASFGVHWCPAPGPELGGLVALADVALYAAKDRGRNCVSIYRPGMAKAA